MESRETIKRSAVILVCAMITLSTTVAVRASNNEMHNFCTDWNGIQEGEFACVPFLEWGPWNGNYDFSEIEDEQQALYLASQVCDDFYFSCWDTCESDEYAERIAQQLSTPECVYDKTCIEGWASTATCQQGLTGSFNCTCSYVNVCLPCE